MTFRLERTGHTPLTLNAANGYWVRAFNMGYPEARAVVDDRPSADGVDDRTEFFGARLVSLDLVARKSRQTAIDELAPFLVPNARPYLYYEAQPGVERRMLLRPRDRRAAWDGPPGKLEMLLQWEAPNGTAETTTEATATATAVVPVEPGLTFDLEFDIVFPASDPTGSVTVTTIGTSRCYPVIELWGPCTDPRIENFDDGEKTLDFSITLGVGDFLQIDTRERTVLLNGNPAQNRYNTIDFTTSEWWTLVPGTNRVRYYPASFSGNSRAELNYRCQFI